MTIPTLGNRGVFRFASPFDALIKPEQIFTVVAIRSLSELQSSNEKPLDTIYVSVNMTEDDFKADLEAAVPVIVFRTDGGEYFYVPGNKVLSDADTSGYEYQEKGVLISLGYLPTGMDLSIMVEGIQQSIYDSTGTVPTVEVKPTSAIISISKEQNDTYLALLANRASVDRSFKTRYEELHVKHAALILLNDRLADALSAAS